ncbi:erythromycin esterase family protein, partial [Rhizobium sp.]|uniref:erythromycin esterase family protein n=1 Tax=Rhizobium sp. TaxID=391 RepID=UPI0034C5F5ED
MWRNKDVDAFVGFLRSHNATTTPDEKVGFYGLDLYNMTCIDRRGACLPRWGRPPSRETGARAMLACRRGHGSRQPMDAHRSLKATPYARGRVTRILVDLLQKELQYARKDGADFFDATQNARLVADAERYYRAMYYGAHESWNQRDNTLQHVLGKTGPNTKAIVLAHNSHIGDARFTDMGMERGELNLGQLCRQAYGKDAALIGFSTHSGTVAAASEWDAPMEIKAVRPSRRDSYEALCHDVGTDRFLLDLRAGQHDELRRVMAEPRLERYIGVIYRPETERWSHYSFASLTDQYDA